MGNVTQRARARVLVTVEIDLRDNWGADCTVGQVLDQASREARSHVARLFEKELSCRVIGETEVTVFILTEKR